MATNESEDYIDPDETIQTTYVIFWAGALDAVRRQVRDVGLALNAPELSRSSESMRDIVIDMLKKANKPHLLKQLGYENTDSPKVGS